MDTFAGARAAWAAYDRPNTFEERQTRYAERWSIYSGSAYSSAMMRGVRRISPALYDNTSLLWSHSKGVVGFYAAHVYQGGISTDGKPLADGTMGAIPILPQVTNDQEPVLRLALAEVMTHWNWEQKKSMLPRMSAVLGNVLTEIIDDVPRRDVYPAMVWPGYVKHIELDHMDNVQAYTVEYYVQTDDETFKYTKMVDKEAFRHFKDDQPWSDPDGHGDAVMPNPYGFVPATWDRHESGWDEYGMAATDSTRQALHMINSLLSHGIDHQRKVFFAPILVKGKVFRPGQTAIDLTRAPRMFGGGGDDGSYMKPSVAQAGSFDLLAAGENASIEGFNFDVGRTLEFIRELKNGVLAEEPEGTFYQDLRQMGQISGTAAERLLGDSASKCRLVRAGHDVQMIKRLQMAMAIGGMRINNGDWGPRSDLRRWQQALAPYDLDSFHRGEMDFRIGDRPIIIPTELERIETILRKESIQTVAGLIEAGIAKDEDEARRMIDERTERFAVRLNRGDFSEDFV